MPAISTTTPTPAAAPAPQPWWRYGHVWLVISGPLVVVVAGFFTLWLAIHNPDPVVSSSVGQPGTPTQQIGEGHGRMAPAQTVRNHTAATLGEVP